MRSSTDDSSDRFAAVTVATLAATISHGCSKKLSTIAPTKVTRSSFVIHDGGELGRPRCARLRQATTSSPSPSTIFATNDAVDGAEPDLSGFPPVTNRVITITPAKVRTHPRMKPS